MHLQIGRYELEINASADRGALNRGETDARVAGLWCEGKVKRGTRRLLVKGRATADRAH
jgi:hypothetical protein